MSGENVDAIKRGYEWATARHELLPELFGSDFELDVKDVAPEFPEVIIGREAAEEGLRDYFATFEDFHVEVSEVIHAEEEQVVAAVGNGGHIKGSDAEVWSRFFHVWTFADGKVVRLSVHTDRTRALEAAGLEE